MFRFTGKPSSGIHSQYLAKFTHLVKSWYVEIVQDVVSVMAAYCDLWGVCAVHCLTVYSDSVPSHSAQYTLNQVFNFS